MPPDFVFIATLGHSDVWVVNRLDESEEERNKEVRLAIHKDSQRAFHEACLRGDVKWSMRPIAGADGIERVPTQFEFDSRQLLLSTGLSERRSDLYEHDCRQGVELCAPLLDGPCQRIRQLQGRHVLANPRHVLLLNTGRKADPGEPVGAFRFVRGRLAEALGLPEEEVCECVYLTEGDVYEEDAFEETHLRAAVAATIDARIKDLALRDDLENAVAVVSDVGGIPEIKAVLAASCRYRFGQVRFVRSPERPAEHVPRRRVLISPAESLGDRRLVRLHLDHGEFRAAARITEHPLGERLYRYEPWRQRIICAAQALYGQEPHLPERGEAESDRWLREVVRLNRRRPVGVVACRVEAALRADDLVMAVRELFTLLDAVVYQMADRYLSAAGQKCINFGSFSLAPGRMTEASRAQLPEKWLEKNSIRLREVVRDRLRRLIPPKPRGVAESLERSVRPARRVRNVATHGIVDHEDVESACAKLESNGVWSLADRTIFLPEGPVADVLRTLGMQDVKDIYRNLVRALLSDMDQLSYGSLHC
jgi:hypothetical protein